MRTQTRVVLNALLAFVSRAVIAAVGLIMVPYLLGHLGEERYGVIGIAGSVLGLLTLIDLGVRPAAGRQFTHFLFAGDIPRSNEVASTSMAIYLAMAMVVVAGVALRVDLLLEMFLIPAALHEEAAATLIIVAASLGFAFVVAPYRSALVSQLRHDVQHYTNVLSAVFRAGFVVAVFSVWEPALVPWAAASLIASILVLWITRRQARRHCPSLRLGPGLVSRRGLRDLSGLAAYSSIAQLSRWVNEESGPLVISALLGIARVAHYVPALVLTGMLRMLSRSFLVQMQPVVTRAVVEGDHDRVRRILVRSVRYSLLSSGAAAVWVATLAFVIVPTWLGAGFRDTAIAMVFLCVSVLLQACAGAAFSVFLGHGRLQAVAAVNALLAAGSVAAAIALVTAGGHGVAGVAMAVCGADAIRSVFMLAGAARIAGVGAWQLWIQSYVGPLASISCMGLIALTLQGMLEEGPLVELGVAGGVSLLAFAVLAWSIGLDAADRRMALSYLDLGWRQLREFRRPR